MLTVRQLQKFITTMFSIKLTICFDDEQESKLCSNSDSLKLLQQKRFWKINNVYTINSPLNVTQTAK